MQHFRTPLYVLQTKDLQKCLSHLDATLTKNIGVGGGLSRSMRLGPRITGLLLEPVGQAFLPVPSLGRSPWFLLGRRRAANFQQGADGVYQRCAAGAQFADTVPRHLLEQLLSPRQ